MMRRTIAAFAVAVALPLLVACDVSFESDGGADISTGLNEGEELVHLTVSRDDEIELGLTNERVFFRLSERMRQEVDRELREEAEGKNGLGAMIVNAVADGLETALSVQVSWAVEDIKEVRWENDALHIELEDGPADLTKVNIDDSDVTEIFRRQDIERFSREFEEVKQRR